MDCIMVQPDSSQPVREGDDVLLFGDYQGFRISLWETARLAGTHPYEILCRIHERVPRIYLNRE